MNTITFSKILYLSLIGLLINCGCAPDKADARVSWRDASHQTVLKNQAMEAKFQAGLLYQLKDIRTGKTLISNDLAGLPAELGIFGSAGINLDDCMVTQQVRPDSIVSKFLAQDGTELKLSWKIEPGKGDIILDMSGRSPEPVDQIRITFIGCDMVNHNAVAVDNYGVGRAFNGPWNGTFGHPESSDYSRGYVHPIVSLFESGTNGWFLEGREERIGPANLLMQGRGETVDVTLAKGFSVKKTNTPRMFEIRFRTYQKHWEDAVDKYLEWMEKDVGFVPLEKKSPAWIRDIKTHLYVRVGDFDTLESLAKRLDPTKVIIGREVGWRMHPMDVDYPDYRPNETAKRWFKRARELGFHVGAHFNTAGVGKNFPDLLERFERGFTLIGTDEDGNKKYYEVEGKNRHRYCSTALKDWRDYLIEQMREAVEVGVDLIYIDESMAAMGNFVVDGMTAVEGVMTLEKEITEAYPNVAIETEQFNPMASRHAAFALSQMPLGHPLSGYIFSRFIHILPESYMCAPTEENMMDAFTSWGFMVPSGGREESWLEIDKAFQDYDLVPDSKLPRRAFKRFESHSSSGFLPISDSPIPQEGYKLFGYRGTNGVIAYFEKQPNKRGLVIYEPGKEPKWVGTRITGVSTWQGPGILQQWTPGIDLNVEWMIYDGNMMMGLDPKKSYYLDEKGKLSPNRFHLTAVPENFTFNEDKTTQLAPIHYSHDGSFYKLSFSGKGRIQMYVPDGMLVFLNGKEIEVNRETKTGEAQIDATPDNVCVLVAFRKTDVELSGKWADMPWTTSLMMRTFYFGQHRTLDYSTEGPVRKMKDINAFYTHVSGAGFIIGRLPEAQSIRLQGAYGMREESIVTDGDGVVRINGNEVVRVPAGKRPYKVQSFDVDISSYAGQYIMMEFVSDGNVHGPTAADWYNPWIVVEK